MHLELLWLNIKYGLVTVCIKVIEFVGVDLANAILKPRKWRLFR